MNHRHAINPTTMTPTWVNRAFGYGVLLVSTGFFFLAVDAVLTVKGY